MPQEHCRYAAEKNLQLISHRCGMVQANISKMRLMTCYSLTGEVQEDCQAACCGSFAGGHAGAGALYGPAVQGGQATEPQGATGGCLHHSRTVSAAAGPGGNCRVRQLLWAGHAASQQPFECDAVRLCHVLHVRLGLATIFVPLTAPPSQLSPSGLLCLYVNVIECLSPAQMVVKAL